jgi:calcineurin-like phosphoesterase family protein
MTTWFTADTHLGHLNIIDYCDRPYRKIDGQLDIEAMDNDLICRWNASVKDDDTVYMLGDFALGSVAKTTSYAERLRGHKILIRGNHDRHTIKKYLDIGFDRVEKHLWIEDNKYLLVHRPQSAEPWCLGPQKPVVLCGHVHEKWTRTSRVFTFPAKKPIDADFINVGVDVRRFSPCTLDDVLNTPKP